MWLIFKEKYVAGRYFYGFLFSFILLGKSGNMWGPSPGRGKIVSHQYFSIYPHSTWPKYIFSLNCPFLSPSLMCIVGDSYLSPVGEDGGLRPCWSLWPSTFSFFFKTIFFKCGIRDIPSWPMQIEVTIAIFWVPLKRRGSAVEVPLKCN